jgi:hypothetical protein
VFEDFRYEREIGTEDASDHALVFRTRVGDRELHGCDFLHTGPDGLIDELTVMVRPRSAMLALAEAMQAEVLAVQRELGVEGELGVGSSHDTRGPVADEDAARRTARHWHETFA